MRTPRTRFAIREPWNKEDKNVHVKVINRTRQRTMTNTTILILLLWWQILQRDMTSHELIKGTVTWDVQNPFLPFVYSQEINAINVSLVRRQSTIKNKTTETEQMKCQQ